MDLYPHKSGLGLMEPVALIRHSVAVLFANVWNYRRVVGLQPIPPFQFLNLGPIVAQANAVRTPAGNLDLRDEEFGQFRWWVLDNIQARLWLPTSTQGYALRNITPPVDLNTPLRDPCLHLTEFFVWEDERPSFDATNIMDYALGQSRLVAQGYRYVLEKLSPEEVAAIRAGQAPCVYVMAQQLGI